MAVPVGVVAERQDQELECAYERVQRDLDPFLIEHVDNLLRRRRDGQCLRAAGDGTVRRAAVRYTWSANLQLCDELMRLWIHGGLDGTGIAQMLTFLHPLLTRVDIGRCYRLGATARFS